MSYEYTETPHATIKRIAVLGSTGSIGEQTLDVVAQHPDVLSVVALAAGSRARRLCEQVRQFGVKSCALANEQAAQQALHEGLLAPDVDLGVGADAIEALVRLPEVDIVVNALVGAAGLRASYETLRAGKVLALANKESLVVGGDLLTALVGDSAGMPAGKHLLPIDSEHGAIFQCLMGERLEHVSRLWVTASGGPFRGYTREQLESVDAAQALAHPTWNMGPKITIDSATLMNKGLEVIEAHHLFGLPYEKISVVVHPQSVIHSMVEYVDGSVKAHLGTTDMRIPIQYALSCPDRWDAPVQPLDFCQLGSLDFFPPDTTTFRCLALAREAGERGGTLPCAMNAANEIAVAAFLDNRIGYLAIAETVEAVMDACDVEAVTSVEQLAAVDAWARARASEYCANVS